MLTYIFDLNGKTPLYQQLYNYIRTDIEEGKLTGEEKLPSKRKLAAHLKISAVTVESAYAQLTAEGYLRAEAKRGFFVTNFESKPRRQEWSPREYKKETELSPRYDFKTNAVDMDRFPFSTWAKLTREVLSEKSNELLKKTEPQGIIQLRREIVNYLYHFRGIKACEDQIVVGAGSEYLIGLIIQLLGADNNFGVENPGYYKIGRIFKSYNINTVPLPMDEHGIKIGELNRSCVNVLHITPSHHFPLGIVMPVSRRADILTWASSGDDRYILEDDYDSEFRFSGKPIPALQGLDRSGKVIYINTFAKTLAPSLRISYLVLPMRLVERYRRQLLFYSCTVPGFEQYVLTEFIRRGHFERHISRMRNLYKARRDHFIEAVTNSTLNNSVEIIGHKAGLHLLLQINNGMNEKQLVQSAKAHDTGVYGLSNYYNSADDICPESTVVMGYAGLTEESITKAVKQLEAAWTV